MLYIINILQWLPFCIYFFFTFSKAMTNYDLLFTMSVEGSLMHSEVSITNSQRSFKAHSHTLTCMHTQNAFT